MPLDLSLTASDSPVTDEQAPIDYAAVTFEDLQQEHPERSQWKEAWSRYRQLYRGGEEFLRAAGLQASTRAGTVQTTGAPLIDAMAARNRRRRFLYQLEGEPDTKYISRWERAYYIGYLGAIVDYFRHYEFSQPPVIRPAESEETPDWHAAFMRNADGNGKSFVDFVKDAFGETLQVRRAGWLIGSIDADIGAQYKGDDDGDEDPPVTLTCFPAEDIVDWQDNDAGELDWILLRKERLARSFPAKRRKVEIRTLVTRTDWAAWEIIEDGKQSEITLVAQGEHDLGRVPFVWLEVPHGLWVVNKLASWQVNLFNQMSMLDYGQLVSCFLQPALTTNEQGADNRVFGEGLTLHLMAGDGQRPPEKFEWIAPPTAPLEFSAKRLTDMRDEGYRIVHQMSLAVDSQAIGAIARSGASKIEDRRATEIILCAYGGYIREAMTTTLDTISEIMGDNVNWVIDGYDNFQVSSLDEELQTAALAFTFDIPSPTFKSELFKMVGAGRVIGHVDDSIKEKIRTEIDDNVAQKFEQDQEMGGAMHDAKLDAIQNPPQPMAPMNPQKLKPGQAVPPVAGATGVKGATGAQGIGKPGFQKKEK